VPSEDVKKVLSALEKVIGECPRSTSVERSRIVLKADDTSCLQRIQDQLRDRHVRSAARRLFLKGMQGDRTTVMMNRQAAAAGVIALCSSEGESALGPIYLTIESIEVGLVIDWLTAMGESTN